MGGEPRLHPAIHHLLQEGTVIPAHPLALDERRCLDEQRQRALTRYYLAAGAGGLAVGVHTTQFAIRDPRHRLLERVLSLAVETIAAAGPGRPIIKVAGIRGPTAQAMGEARLAADLGYDLGLLSPGGLQDDTADDLLERAREVAAVIPLFGFYLQPAAGGRPLDSTFWERFVEIPGVAAIKIAPFDRYRTLDVVRAVCHSTRRGEIALYTGNDDAIVTDLLTPFRFVVDGQPVEKRIVGGLLGQWAVWTSRAVALLDEVKRARAAGAVPESLLTLGAQLTDANAAIFDPAHGFHGCIPGIHEILYRQGLLAGTWCLRDDEMLSAGQGDAINRVCRAYPHLVDDGFVQGHLGEWLAQT
ncbi:MAG: dihydrodipicolinate synthase family protein [Chloroflexota bacterium]